MRVLIVGNGLVGAALAGRLDTGSATGEAAESAAVVVCSRRRRSPAQPGEPTWIALDATDAAACRRAVDLARPDAVVLAHGPSDVTWCETHPDDAILAHTTATTNLVTAAPSARFIMISTDNVFDGASALANDESASTGPANAYGCAKLRAEQVLLGAAVNATVLRVSLIYGWQPAPAGSWLNHFAQCVERLRRDETVAAAYDHWNTPVLLDDAARVIVALLPAATPPLLHLGGPDRISRFEWARRIADALGYPRGRVVGVPRRYGRYACRPANACLTSTVLPTLTPTRDIEIRGVNAGIAALLREPASKTTTPGTPGTPDTPDVRGAMVVGRRG